jgi:hypothetical protein
MSAGLVLRFAPVDLKKLAVNLAITHFFQINNQVAQNLAF